MNKTPQHPVEQAFLQAVEACSTPRRWLIGYSGGLDSQVLAHLAVSFLAPDQVRLIHINHGLQAAAADFEHHCRLWATAYACALDVIRVQPDSDTEEAARDARYTAFAEQLETGDILLLGQHADDQAETLLFRMLRGTGLKGLAGIPKQRTLGAGTLLRPLLKLSRTQLERYAQELQLSWVEDPSNADTRYTRNFLRHQLFKPLQQRWPQAGQTLAELAEHLAEQHDLLAEFGREDLAKALGPQGELRMEYAARLSPARRANLLQVWLARWQLALNKRLLKQAELLLGVGADRQPQVRLSDGSTLRCYGGGLYRVPAFSVQPVRDAQPLQSLELAHGQLCLEPVRGQGLKTLEGLSVRYRQPGDRIWLAERAVHQSLKNFFQERSVPPWLRDHWPLICAGEELVAVTGLYIAKDWRVTGQEQCGYRIIWCSFGLSEGGCFAIL